ncbi:MAG: sigma-54 dependent transcriptional regulator [Calditrichia bacterium]
MQIKLFILDDDVNFNREIGRFLQRHQYVVQTAETLAVAREQLPRFSPDIALLDLQLPDGSGLDIIPEISEKFPYCLILMISGHSSIPAAVEAIKMGAENFLTKPVHPDQLLITLDRLVETRRLRGRNAVQELQLSEQLTMVTGSSPKMQEVLAISRSAAESSSTILISGETGTGKHLLAHYIHQNSPRAKFPFVYVNCASLSETLLESDLFGHERGAFTGAHARKKGRVELAHGGTLFLDEIGEIPPSLQTKLLHFIEYGQFQRVGGTETLHADVRVICATNRDLVAEVKKKQFREDLYFRVNVIRIEIPPLREHPEDIPEYLDYFLRYFSRELGKTNLKISEAVQKKLLAYPWPGNIRELKNAVERAVVLSRGPVLGESDFPLFRETISAEGENLFTPGPLQNALNQFKKDYIRKVLNTCGGNQRRAAEILQIQRTYLNRLIKELGIE